MYCLCNNFAVKNIGDGAMKQIIISTENTSDLTQDILQQRNISCVNMHYFLDGKEFDGKEAFDSKAFYDAMRNGAMTKTSLVNEYDAEQYLTELLKQGKDIVHISFASACSGTVANFVRVAEKLNKQSSNKIYVVDSLCESGGQGLLVTLVDDFAEQGKSAKEVYEYAEALKHRICHYFCVEDIAYLARGGRISKFKAFVAGIMKIKPVLYSDTEGRLVAISKEMSRKKSLLKLVEFMQDKYNGESDRVYICCADCDEDGQFVADKVKETFGMQPVLMPLGPVIGSHSGPGTVALFFTANNRNKKND